jgi:hypothetical protein
MRFFVTILLIGLDVSDFAGEKPIYKMWCSWQMSKLI